MWVYTGPGTPWETDGVRKLTSFFWAHFQAIVRLGSALR